MPKEGRQKNADSGHRHGREFRMGLMGSDRIVEFQSNDNRVVNRERRNEATGMLRGERRSRELKRARSQMDAAEELKLQESKAFYEELRQAAYEEVYQWGGFDEEGESSVSEPAYKFPAYFLPIAWYMRHRRKGEGLVKEPTYRSIPKGEPKTWEISFGEFKGKQDNTGGAFVRGKGPGS